MSGVLCGQAFGVIQLNQGVVPSWCFPTFQEIAIKKQKEKKETKRNGGK